MSAGITSIALFAPIVASNAIFSARRASKGADAIGENPLYAMMNFDIAAAQTLKGARAIKGLAIANNANVELLENGAKEVIKGSSTTSKVLKGAGKIVNLTADYINPFICITSGFKVLKSEDKPNEAASEIIRLGTMFAFEKGAKAFVGMPYTEKVAGKTVTKSREGVYKKLFSEKQLNAVSDFCKTKKVLKYAPGFKGLLFVGASIAGYELGDKIANAILKKDSEKQLSQAS